MEGGLERGLAALVVAPPPLLSLPSELLALVVLAVPRAADVARLARTCRTLRAVSSLPSVRAEWLVKQYGKSGAWHGGLRRHRRMMAGSHPAPAPPPPDDDDDDAAFADVAWSPVSQIGAAGSAGSADPPTVAHALLCLGLPPPRCLVQEFFGWFANLRNGFRAWDREDGAGFDGELDGAWDAETVAGDGEQGWVPVEWNGDNPAQNLAALGALPGVQEFILADAPALAADWLAANMPPGAIADGEPAGPPALEAIDPMLSDGEDGVQHDDEVATTEPEDDADMDEASGASGSDDDSASSTSTDPTPAPSPSQPAPVPLPPSLAFLPLPPRHSPPQAPQPHDQVLLTHVLACASAAYGPAHIALLGRDELLLERLLRLELGDDGDGGDWDGEEGGRRWLAARRAAYVRNRAEVRRIIFAYLYSPRPPIFRPRPPHPPSLAQPALSLLSSLLVHSPPLLSSLLRRAAMPPSQAAPQLIAHLLRLAPLPALRTALSNPEAERLGFGLSRGTVVALWDTEDAAPLRLLAEGMLLGGVPGPEALRGWAAERLREIWDTLTLPVLGGGAKSRALAREAARGNPMLAGMLRAGGADEARRREREGFEVRSRAFVRVLVGSWDEGEWPGVLFGVFAPRFEARPGWEGTVLDAFLLPEVDGWTPARARLAVDAVCALMRAHRAHAGAQDGLGFPAAQVERLLRFADAAYAYLFRCAEDGTSTPEEAERDAQTGGGTFMITPGAGVFCGLAREAADRMVGKTGVEFEDEVVRLQLLLDSAVDITVPEDSGTILDFWELDDAGRVLNHPPVPPSHPHSEILHLTARMVQDAAREILRRNQASHRSVRRATGAPQEPASPNLAQLFSPDRETFDEDEEEDVGLVWSGGAGGPGADDSAGKEITWEELADKGGGVRRIVVWTGAVAGVEGIGIYLSDHTFRRLGKRHLLRPPTDVMILEPGEQIVRITGSTAVGFGRPFVARLQVHTDRRSGPEWGQGGDREFRLEAPRRPRSRSRDGARDERPGPAHAGTGDSSLGVPSPGGPDGEPRAPRPILGISAAPSPPFQLSGLRVAWKYRRGLDRKPGAPAGGGAFDRWAAAGAPIPQQAIEGLAMGIGIPEEEGIED